MDTNQPKPRIGELDAMVLLIESKPLANAEQTAAINREINRMLKERGYHDVDMVRQRMALPVQRIIQARKLANEQLLALVEEDERLRLAALDADNY